MDLARFQDFIYNNRQYCGLLTSLEVGVSVGGLKKSELVLDEMSTLGLFFSNNESNTVV